MTAVEFLESQYKFNGQLFKSDFQQAKEIEDSQATEYAKWSMDINELTGHFFTFCEWIKDEPKDDETSKQE